MSNVPIHTTRLKGLFQLILITADKGLRLGSGGTNEPTLVGEESKAAEKSNLSAAYLLETHLPAKLAEVRHLTGYQLQFQIPDHNGHVHIPEYKR